MNPRHLEPATRRSECAGCGHRSRYFAEFSITQDNRILCDECLHHTIEKKPKTNQKGPRK